VVEDKWYGYVENLRQIPVFRRINWTIWFSSIL